MAVHLSVAGDVFGGVFLCCPFFHEMSWMRSGTILSKFLRVFLPTLVLCCPFSHEMSCMESGTELSQFL